MPELVEKHAEMLGNRLRKTLKHRRKWATKVPTEAYRVYDRDIPEVPVIVDVYGEHLHLADVRFDRQVEEWPVAWLDAIVASASAASGVPVERVHVKSRQRQRGAAQYEKLAASGSTLVVAEQGLRFEVNLDDYLDTGLFLDHRPLRARVREEAGGSGGLRFLNLFAYTGSFSVYALAGGASRATTVDLSRTYLDWGRRNLALNQLADARDERVQADAFGFLREAADAGRRWDLVVVDPPTFSNSKRFEGTFDVRRDHRALIRAALEVTSPGGVVYFSTNRRKFSLAGELDHAAEALGADAYRAEEITDRTVPDDFAQKRPHRCWRFERAD